MRRSKLNFVAKDFVTFAASPLAVATGEFRFGAVVLIKKLVFNVAYEKVGVAGSHFGTHGHTIDLFKHFTCISANVIYCISYTLQKFADRRKVFEASVFESL